MPDFILEMKLILIQQERLRGKFVKAREQHFKLFGIVAALFLSFFFSQITGCATTKSGQTGEVAEIESIPEKVTDAENSTESIEETWGIQIIGIRQTAAGYMLNFRYRVIDPEKAAPLFNRQTKPYLIDQASGAKFAVPNPPKTGPLRTSDPPKAGRNYFIFFANPGKYVKLGNKVTVVIGDFKAENLVVE